ncbi:MAG: response regulator transcription factor [Nitrospirota bacterium]|nr:response regulator transcription factor [Nitrospirota bacterium]MDH5586091.1 response regulator transcription factor [Nitrospirota bacterium]MDH5774571.1 response regulator transcription factor [Nitrospirota bacterium]
MNSGARILVVDDEPQIRRSLQVNLENKGYAVFTAATGEEALETIARRTPDVVIVDLLLPSMDGITLTRHIREQSSVPIIVLSAIGDEPKKVNALEAGADDYVTKPFGMEELAARIKSALRRTMMLSGSEPVFTSGGLSINFERREVRLNNEPVKLTPTEYDLLKYMIQHSGKVLTHRTLLTAIWGEAYADQAQYLRVFIGQLRKKLERNTARPQYILTDSGVGYRFATISQEENP